MVWNISCNKKKLYMLVVYIVIQYTVRGVTYLTFKIAYIILHIEENIIMP